MNMCLHVIVIGIISFVGGVSQVIPEIFIPIGLFMMGVGIAISEMNGIRLKERIDRLKERIDHLEGKVKELEEKKKEND